MTRLYALLFAIALTLNACAHVQPVISTVVTCSGETIPPGLVDEVYTDIMTENWGDLATVAVPALADGWADVVCIYDALKSGNPALVPHMEKLKAGHVELRGPSASLRCPTLEKMTLRSPGDSTPPTGPMSLQKPSGEAVAVGNAAPADDPSKAIVPAPPAAGVEPGDSSASPAKPAYSYPGPNIGAVAATCDDRCGVPNRGLASPGSECLCLHENRRDERLSYWSEAR